MDAMEKAKKPQDRLGDEHRGLKDARIGACPFKVPESFIVQFVRLMTLQNLRQHSLR